MSTQAIGTAAILTGLALLVGTFVLGYFAFTEVPSYIGASVSFNGLIYAGSRAIFLAVMGFVASMLVKRGMDLERSR